MLLQKLPYYRRTHLTLTLISEYGSGTAVLQFQITKWIEMYLKLDILFDKCQKSAAAIVTSHVVYTRSVLWKDHNTVSH